ncbi:carbohydrate kinase family protein [Hoeflea prorocentri]|uniref:Carbohydrate kinase family protein n=1 Tax=Hoeflea prorocentri TaxID=1922333 RepID=A0A9X3UFE2_9HYPH|nr:carbohydrate kinase family protein [Hoeflea prorocentri]MCY6380343.1 carbohydrate kinase family protein [Hoeflea prorocentri]MDA5398143.1 carbohydrate kinase family protein [Hoeflea prorocentri]
MARVLVLGGAHIDRRATLDGATVPGASNPGRWHEEAGGGGFNAARIMARLDNAVSMVSVRGGDAAAEIVATAVEAAGIVDMAQVFLDRRTPSYSAVLEADGNLHIAVADMDLYDRFVYRQLSRKSIRQAVAAADLVLCDANLPEQTLAALARMTHENRTKLAAIAISPAKVGKLTPAFAHMSVIFMNAAEAVALCGDIPPENWPQELRKMGIARASISRGKDPLLAYDDDDVFQIRPLPIDAIVDVTGAGDTLAAASLHAYLAGYSFRDALRYGTAAAGLTIQSREAAPAHLNEHKITEVLQNVPPAQPLP